MHRDLINSQAHGEFLQISVYAEEHYIKHRHTQSRWNRKKMHIWLVTFSFMHMQGNLLLDKVKQIQKLQWQIQLRKIIIGQIDNITV
jgi:hypothetical protein